MSTEHATWLAGHREEPIDPDERICDPHHHLWEHPANNYLLDELWADTGAGHNVTSTVFVECMSGYRSDGPEHLRTVGESDFVREIAEASGAGAASDRRAEILGIVGFTDLTMEADLVEEALRAHDEAGGGRFRGIRHAATWDASPKVHNAHTKPPEGLLGHDDFNRGFAVLGRLGFSFDAWVYHHQLGEVVELARRHPEVPIVLDHLGGPIGVGPYRDRRDEVLEAWRPTMVELAGCENVYLKVGGIGMSMFGLGWHKQPSPPSSEALEEAWGPVIRWCLDAFGADRCMFESNFPVDKQSCSYTVLWNTFQRIAASASPAERADLFHDTATRFYRLSPEAAAS